MKYFYIILALVSLPLWAGEYYFSHIDNYDASTGLYYKAITDKNDDGSFLSSKASQGQITNINIFNPADDSSTQLFKTAPKDGISVFLYENEFKNGLMEFFGTASNGKVLNNTNIDKRAPKDKLLVGVRNISTKEVTLFISDKKGSGLKKLVTMPQNTDWHIDVKNSKLRVVKQTAKGLTIESFNW